LTLYFLKIKPVIPLHPQVLSAEDSNISLPTSIPTIVPTDTPTPTESLPTPTISPSPTVTLTPQSTTQKKGVVAPSVNSYVNVRQSSDRNSPLVSKVLSGSEVLIVSEKFNELGEKWVKISQGDIQGWALGELVQNIQSSSVVSPSAKVKINVPDHDVVYIYSKPSYNASITQKINESQTADILLETKMWAKVILSRINVEGWVSQDFIQKNIP
jgi:uncharacterized protein YgiM (DUF1202 family)